MRQILAVACSIFFALMLMDTFEVVKAPSGDCCKGRTGICRRFGAAASSASACRGASRQGEIPYWQG
jgi:hypothetical protein